MFVRIKQNTWVNMKKIEKIRAEEDGFELFYDGFENQGVRFSVEDPRLKVKEILKRMRTSPTLSSKPVIEPSDQEC